MPNPAAVAARRRARTLLLAVALVAAPAVVRAQEGELESLYVTPANPTSADHVVVHAVTACSNPFAGDPVLQGNTVVWNTTSFGLYPPCAFGLPPLTISFDLGKLPPQSYTLEVIGNGGVPAGTVVASYTFTVRDATSTLAVNPTIALLTPDPTTAQHVRLHVRIDADPSQPGRLPTFVVDHTENDFVVTTAGVQLSPTPPPPYEADLDLGVLTAGSYTATLRVAGEEATLAFAVSQPPTAGLDLLGGQFVARVVHAGSPVAGVTLSSEAGYFWFFDSANPELTVKLLDGRGVNGHYWLFVASMTTEPFELDLTDLRGTCAGAGCTRVYRGVAGKHANIIDLAAAQ
jgi:hypothetical protein